MNTETRTATAWDSIGWDDGPFRIVGGRATYEAVMFCCATPGDKVKLARLDSCWDGDRPVVREVSRYVDPDTELEFLPTEKPT